MYLYIYQQQQLIKHLLPCEGIYKLIHGGMHSDSILMVGVGVVVYHATLRL